MKEYAISIIIPVYNGEKYLKRCLDSIVNQTIFSELQIIVVNDGSTDNTLSIIKKYKEVYGDNIVVANIPNGGVSNARNVGIEIATGKYLTFVDADDWVDQGCYEKMYRKAQESLVDIVAAGFFISNDNKDILKNNAVVQEKKKLQKDIIVDFLCGKIDVHCYDKIFLREVVGKIRFDTKLKIAEDRKFLFDVFLVARSVYFIPDIFYHYYQNADSVMHNISGSLNMDGIKVSQLILDKIAESFQELKPYAESMYISMACRVYCELEENNQKNSREYKKLKNDIKQYRLIDGIRYMSVKHLISLGLAKTSPQIFNKLRRNTFIRFMK